MKLNWFEKLFMNSFFRPPKQRKEALLMRQLGGDVSNGRVIELGCGRGAGVEIILDVFRPATVEAFDFDPDQVHLARLRLEQRYHSRVRVYEGSATKIPSPDDCFDAVFDFGALHHIPDNDTALREIARVLKYEGRFFFMELLASFTMSPLMRLLTNHPPEAQFTWVELSHKIAQAGLVVSQNGFALGSTRVVGVAHKRTDVAALD